MNKWYFKEIHLDRDAKLPIGWFRAGVTSCRRDIAVKYCPRWHKKGLENAFTREEIVEKTLLLEEQKEDSVQLQNLHRALDKSKNHLLSSFRRKRS